MKRRTKKKIRIIALVLFGESICMIAMRESLKIWLSLLLISLLLIILTGKAFGKKYYRKSKLGQIDKMTGKEFETYLASRFEMHGYKVQLTPNSNDYGADLILKKRRKKTVVQAKRYKGKVGNAAVQEVVASKAYYKAQCAMVITNSYFSKNAINLAKANNVILIDRNNVTRL